MGRIWIVCKQCGERKEVPITAKDVPPIFCSKKCASEYRKDKPAPPKINWTEEQDNLIRFAYCNFKHPTKALDYLQKQPLLRRFRRAALSRRASKLGVTKRTTCTNKKLSPEEIEIIERYAGSKSAKAIAKMLRNKGYDRTWRTIQYYCNKHGYSYKLDYYSLEETREILGFPPRERIKKWLEDGLLLYSYKRKQRYIIKPIAIAKFIREHPFELIRYKVDLPFVVALLDEFRPHQTKSWRKNANKFHKADSEEFQELAKHRC